MCSRSTIQAAASHLPSLNPAGYKSGTRLQVYTSDIVLSFVVLVGLLAGKVVGVTDGDTITVLVDRQPVKVRLDGIDCPEKLQAFGTKAKQLTSDLAFGKQVTIKVVGKDRYKRVIGIVGLPDGKNLNQEIVAAGLAWWYRKYAPKNRALEDLEKAARIARRGLWAEPNPVPPWAWRKGILQ